jgi:uncharacterized coiled-coil protein SlyX
MKQKLPDLAIRYRIFTDNSAKEDKFNFENRFAKFELKYALQQNTFHMENSIIVQKKINASIEKVWQALTDKKELPLWYFDDIKII